jgi:cytochrome c-type biogenesis protein
MNPENLSFVVAFGAGVLSFVSPCVLPLVPAYIGHLAGHSLTKEPGDATSPVRTVSHAAAFILGFTVVFVALGATVGLVGYVFQDVVKSLPFRVATGALLVVLGLHMAGVLRINALYRDTRLMHLRPSPRFGLLTSFLIGTIFAAGWTPCIGPILGTILGLGLQQGTVAQGALLLTAYSLGLGVPFLVAGFALESATRVIRRLNRHAHAVEITSGGLMVAMGFLVMFNVLTWIAAYATRLGFTGI